MVDSIPPKCAYQIGKSHLIEALILLFVVMICFSKADDNLTWKIEKKAKQYGADIRLSCQVGNCCKKSAGWGKWTSDDQFNTIFIDVKDLHNEESLKYGGGTDETGFFLIIRNITRDDLNIQYSCTYGFLVSKKKMLLEKDAFFGLPKTISTEQRSKDTTEIMPDFTNKLERKLKIILSFAFVAVAVFIGLGAIIVCYYKVLRNNSDDNSDKAPEDRPDITQPTDHLLKSPDYLLSQTEKGSKGAIDTLVTYALEPDQIVRPRRNISSSSLKSIDSFTSCSST